MKKRFFPITAVGMLTILAACSPPRTEEAIRIVPQPNEIQMQSGRIVLSSQEKDALLNAQTNKDLDNLDFIISVLSDTLPTEAYSINITSKEISLNSSTAKGEFYALKTLQQIVRHEVLSEADTVWFLPAARISDAPRFSYRGLHFDVSRHYRDMDFLKKQIDAMSRYKLNTFHWHFTDGAGWRMEVKAFPELHEQAAWRPYPTWKDWWKGGRKYCTQDHPDANGGYYSHEDMKELVEYAAARHITIIPEIEMPGHSEEVLAVFPQLSCSGKPYVNSEFCVGNEETFAFLEKVLDETMDIFPSEYIHIGGDEVGKGSWSKCPKCQKRIKDEALKDEEELQSYMIKRIEKYLNSKGRQLMGWDEILEGGLSPTATVMSWRGEDGGIKAAQSGNNVVMTPGGFCYFDFYQDNPLIEPEAIGGYLPLEKVYSYNPTSSEQLTEEQARYILGVQANVWTEYIPTEEHAEYMIYPRLLALSEVAWTDVKNKDYAKFKKATLKENRILREKGYNPFDIENESGNKIESRQKIDHIAIGAKVKYNNTEVYKDYTAGGDSALVDGWKGDWTYLDKRWQGVANQTMDFTIDLGKETEISHISAECMQLIGPWVWLPASLSYSISADGKQYKEIYKQQRSHDMEAEGLIFQTFEWNGKEKARYIRTVAKVNEKEQGFIFMDEIVVR